PNRMYIFAPPVTYYVPITHPLLEVAAINFRRDQSVLGAVLRNIGIEEIDVYSSHPQFPKPSENFPIENRHGDEKLGFAAANFSDRQVIKILVEINRGLNAVLIDLLPEIAVPIEQTNRNEMQIKVARGFAVVAGENAEAAGVVRDRFVKTEFGRKIGDGILDCRAGTGFPIGVAASEIFLEVLENLLKLPQEIFVLCKFFQTRLSRKLE